MEVVVSQSFLTRLMIAGGGVEIYLVEIPKDLKPDKFADLHEAESLGAKILESRGFSRVPQVQIPGSNPMPIPSTPQPQPPKAQ
jgi:hypothetical protein